MVIGIGSSDRLLSDEECAYLNLAQDGRYGPQKKAEAMLRLKGIPIDKREPLGVCDAATLTHRDWDWITSLGVGSFGVDCISETGVYCLGTNAAGILYVGQSTNIANRLFVHAGKSMSQDSVCVGLWDVCWTVEVDYNRLDFVESVLILAIMPPLNSRIPNGYDKYLKNKALAAEVIVAKIRGDK